MDTIVDKLTADESPRMVAGFGEGRLRRVKHLAGREVRAELVVGGGFALFAAGLALLGSSSDSVDPAAAILATVVLAAFSAIRIEIGASYTAPIELAFVPMLFMVPPELVPAFSCAALMLGRLPQVLRGRIRPDRVLLSLGDGWFAAGPAIILTVTGTTSAVGASWPILVTAFLAQITIEFVVGALRDRLHGDSHGLVQQLHESALVLMFDAALAPIGYSIARLAESETVWLLLACPLAFTLGTFAREREGRLEKMLELSNAYRGTAKLLGEVVEHDDAYTGEHVQGVRTLAIEVAEELNLGELELTRVESAALLHDVGKIAIPKEIINKPGSLNDEEWEIIKTHTVIGQEMLEKIGGLMESIGGIVRSCHERYDGKGYPDGLSGDQIPIEARVIFCCDAFNAMTTTRSYRQAMGAEEAIASVRQNAGTQFDPEVAAALERCLRARLLTRSDR